MSQNLYEIHRQWATRSADERFASLQDLLDYTQRIKSPRHKYFVELMI